MATNAHLPRLSSRRGHVGTGPAFVEDVGRSVARVQREVTPSIAGLTDISGPCDLPLVDSRVVPVFAGVVDQAAVKLPGLVDAAHPRTLLIYGTDYMRVKPAHSERYAVALREAGIPVQLKRLVGTGHAAVIARFAAPLQFLNDASGLTVTWLEGLPERAPASGS